MASAGQSAWRWSHGGTSAATGSRGTTPRCAPALALWGTLSPQQVEDLRADARHQWTGVPASEPGWVRLLDGTLAALALDELGEREAAERWQVVVGSVFALRGGHRPSCAYAPLAMAGPWAPTWEHAAATALTGAMGQPVEDWPALRQRALGAAARGPSRPDDERLIAAGRIHARLAGDRRPLAASSTDPRSVPTPSPLPSTSLLSPSAQAPGRGRAGATSAGCASNGPRTWRLGSFERALPSRPNRGG